MLHSFARFFVNNIMAYGPSAATAINLLSSARIFGVLNSSMYYPMSPDYHLFEATLL